jgi:hypothetical protein
MLALKAHGKIHEDKMQRKAKEGAFRGLGHASGYLRKTARSLIRRSKKPAPADSPMHTRFGRAKEAIMYDVSKDKSVAVIGPVKSRMGKAFAAHEFGGRFRGDNYPKRSVMGPALEKIRHRLPKSWRAVVS